MASSMALPIWAVSIPGLIISKAASRATWEASTRLIVAAQVNCDGGIGNIAVHVHTHIQLDHILAKTGCIKGRRRIMSRVSIQRYVAGKGGLCAPVI